LQCGSQPVRIEFHLIDWDFIDYPRIKVLSGIDRTLLLPHLGIGGGLCYFRNGEVALDRYRPGISVAQCLVQAQTILEKLKSDPTFRREDLQAEFEVYWLQTDKRVHPVLLGTLLSKAGIDSRRSTYWRITWGSESCHLLGDDSNEVAKLAASFGATAYDTTDAPCWLFETSKLPAVPDKMPTTVLELFTWLKTWDRKLYSAIQRTLGSERGYLEYKGITFAVQSPAGWLGFGFEHDQVQRKFAKRSLKNYRNYLHNLGGQTKIFRLQICDVSPSFVHSRNLTHPDLREKKITVVGVGAIGSHVAQALVRLGAGTGRGRLLLVDNDRLSPENLGRHVLGYPALFEYKSEAMAIELKRAFPLSRIDAETSSAVDLTSLFEADLVINATGVEPLSEALNNRHQEEGLSVPLLHTWVLGNGEAVQALWVCGSKLACFHCLRVIAPDGQLKYRFPVLDGTAEIRQIGCQAFTPYAISAPLQAAGLATEMIVDWLRSKSPSPRFRTRLTENAQAHKVKNQDATRLEQCMACSRDL
jgi:molybdopterin/thiamine biosynthesis adenylyltransferase